MSEILVSVSVLTYNHEDYIEQCLLSILNQKVNFRFEIIVGQDFSSDRTLSICNRIASQYPDVIKVINYNVNLGLLENTVNNLKNCQGKYIAMCDGDDYWIDDKKLQEQIDFLEGNSDYVMCFSKCIIDSSVIIPYKMKFHLPKNETLSVGEIIQRHYMPTSSIMFKASCLDEKIFHAILNSHVNDLPLEILISMKGKVRFFDKNFSAYRINDKSFTNNLEHQRKAGIGQVKMYILLNRLTNYNYSFYFFVIISKNLLSLFKNYVFAKK